MKIITYQNKKTFKLTDVEFKKANESWGKRANYWCSRIEAILTPMFLYAETPRDEIGKEIYIDENCCRFYKKQDKFLYLDNGPEIEVDYHNSEMEKNFKDKLVLQEDFYNKTSLKILDKKIDKLIK